MSKKYMYLFGAAILALSGISASAQSAQAKGAHHYRRTNVTRNYQRYFINAPQSISDQARTLSGTASRGVYVTLQTSNHKTIASTHANRKTGRYTLRVPKKYASGTHLTVMAKHGYDHPYRIVFVKTPANQKAAEQTNRKTTKKAKPAKRARKLTKRTAKKAKVAKKNSKNTAKKSKATNKAATKQRAKRSTKRARKVATKKSTRKPSRKSNPVTIKDPNGNWKTRQSKHYTQKWSLSQSRGLNEALYHNGRYDKKLVTNAPYHVHVNVSNNVWTINYQPHNQAKSKTIYMHFLNNNRFNLTNRQGRHASLSFVRF